MLKRFAIITGVVFLLIGLLGFVPALAPADDMGMPVLLGLFMVGTLHNIVHLLSGALALVAGFTSSRASRLYFQVFGIVYALVTVVGFIQGSTVLGLFPVNAADNLLHLVLAAAFIYLGFFYRTDEAPARVDA